MANINLDQDVAIKRENINIAADNVANSLLLLQVEWMLRYNSLININLPCFRYPKFILWLHDAKVKSAHFTPSSSIHSNLAWY